MQVSHVPPRGGSEKSDYMLGTPSIRRYPSSKDAEVTIRPVRTISREDIIRGLTMFNYLILSHVKGDRKGSFAQTEIQATSDEDAQGKVLQLLQDWRENEDLIGQNLSDYCILVRVVEHFNIK